MWGKATGYTLISLDSQSQRGVQRGCDTHYLPVSPLSLSMRNSDEGTEFCEIEKKNIIQKCIVFDTFLKPEKAV